MRITGGRHRSRALVAPRGTATRPTSDRVREALFAILHAEEPIDGARVLDLYAGTGALALEALSRGAGAATLVERARDALAAIRTNVDALRVADRVRILTMPVERALRSLGGPFDLVFVDPPYADVASGDAVRSLASIVLAGAFAPGARVVLEHAAADVAPEISGLVLEHARRYGDTRLAFYRAISPAERA
jgi:16S rRNA (guanine966-N2)-methyltransferase